MRLVIMTKTLFYYRFFPPLLNIPLKSKISQQREHSSNAVSHFKINPKKTQERYCSTQRGSCDWQPVPHRSLSWKQDSVKTACILAQSRSVYLPEQLVGEFHSQAAAAFHLGPAIKSLQMQMLPERHAAREEKEVQPGED